MSAGRIIGTVILGLLWIPSVVVYICRAFKLRDIVMDELVYGWWIGTGIFTFVYFMSLTLE